MRIAVNTRLLISGKMDGIGWFTSETIRRIVVAHPEHEFYFFFDRKPEPAFIFASNVHPVVLCPQARHPILWYLFFEWSVPAALRRYKIDLFVSPDGFIPTHCKVPTLSVIHDINFEHAENNLKPSHQRFMTHYFQQYACKATRVATVSEFSKSDIVETYHVSPQKIDVVYDGAHTQHHPYGAEADQNTRNQFVQGCPYFIFVSTILKRKNLANLLIAFDRFKKTDTAHTKLVVVGARVWWQDELKEAYEHLRYAEDVVFLGHADTETLSRLLSAAIALVYPSFFEGFGIPIIEAFHAETPVITSNCTSMPEVAGDAAILIDPHDADAIAAALTAVTQQPQLCEQLVEKGRERRKQFSWDITADLLWRSIEKTTVSL